MSRIIEQKVRLNTEKVVEFFEQRAEKFDDTAPYSSILYQDKTPELAVQRDLFEKTLVSPLLKTDKKNRILDIGCGVGRWAESLINNVQSYTGIDISPKFIGIAAKRIKHPIVEFKVAGAKDVTRADIAQRGPFDLVIMSGIMIYLNDDTCTTAYRNYRKLWHRIALSTCENLLRWKIG